MTFKPPVTGPEKDDICPNFHKPLHKVCPTCHFYQHLQGRSAIKRYEGDQGEWLDFWGCALAAQFAMMSGVSKSADEQTIEMNVLRNKFIEMAEAQRATVEQLGKAVNEMVLRNEDTAQKQMMLNANIARTINILAQQIAQANNDRARLMGDRMPLPVITEQ